MTGTATPARLLRQLSADHWSVVAIWGAESWLRIGGWERAEIESATTHKEIIVMHRHDGPRVTIEARLYSPAWRRVEASVSRTPLW